MNLLDLAVKISCKDEASSKLSGIASNITGTMSTAAGVVSAVMGSAAVAGAVAIGKSALDAYASYEQMVGGVETLFKSSAGIVEGYAAGAYQTAGVSANKYMEQATAFSASLIQSLGGDTDAAAEYANQAIMDMSDNANKMGTSIDSIQMTYQSLMRGNYAMLDNLKLGYGGTKTELERLVSDASKLTGQALDPTKFSDIITAIHAVQENLGITGTTALEAATTIEGSVGMAKAAWENWLTGLGDENADLNALTDNLVSSVTTAAGNIVPRVEQIVASIGTVLASRAPDVINTFYNSILSFLPQPVQSVVQSVVGAVQSAISQVPGVISSAFSAVSSAVPGIVSTFSGLFQTAFEGASGYVDRFVSTIQGIATIVTPVISGIITGVQDFAAAFVGAFALEGGSTSALASLAQLFLQLQSPLGIVSQLVTNFGGELTQLASSVGSAIVPILTQLGTILGGTIAAVLPAIQALLQSGMSIISALIPTLANLASAILPTISSVIAALVPAIMQVVTFVSSLVTAVAPLVAQLVSAVLPVITNIVTAVMNFVTAVAPLVGTVLATIGAAINALLPIITTIVSVVVSMASEIITVVGNVMAVVINIVAVVTSVVSTVASLLGNILQVVLSVFQGIASTVGSVISTVASVISSGFNAVVNTISSAVNSVASFIAGMLSNVSNTFSSIVSVVTSAASNAYNAVRNAFSNMVSAVSGAIGNVVSFVQGLPGQILGIFSNVGSWLVNSGKSLIQGFIDGIKSMIGNIGSTISGALETARSFFPFSPAKRGPFSGRGYTTYSGRALMRDFAGSIAENAPRAVEAVSSMLGEVRDAFDAPVTAGVDVTAAYSAMTPEVVAAGSGSVRATTAPGSDGSDEVVEAIRSLHDDLGRIIGKYTPTMTGREYRRMVKSL